MWRNQGLVDFTVNLSAGEIHIIDALEAGNNLSASAFKRGHASPASYSVGISDTTAGGRLKMWEQGQTPRGLGMRYWRDPGHASSFGAIDIPGVFVAIVAFTLLFGAATGSIMWNAIRAVDSGQSEAGRALGFSDQRTFFLVVLPQAARRFVPLLIAQFVNLIKDTAVVGYIAVQDLTRVGDLVRARTLEAFFPLIAIAIIYFMFCWLMSWLLKKLAKRLEPKDEPRTIKGVQL